MTGKNRGITRNEQCKELRDRFCCYKFFTLTAGSLALSLAECQAIYGHSLIIFHPAS